MNPGSEDFHHVLEHRPDASLRLGKGVDPAILRSTDHDSADGGPTAGASPSPTPPRPGPAQRARPRALPFDGGPSQGSQARHVALDGALVHAPQPCNVPLADSKIIVPPVVPHGNQRRQPQRQPLIHRAARQGVGDDGRQNIVFPCRALSVDGTDPFRPRSTARCLALPFRGSFQDAFGH